MEWIRRNPTSAVALSALAVLSVLMLVWALGGSEPAADEPATLGVPSLTPSPTPQESPSALPSPSATPSSLEAAIAGFPAGGMGAVGDNGTGFNSGLTQHRIVIAAGSDGPLLGVGWRIPTADGKRAGKDESYRSSFRHATRVYGKPDYAQLYTFVGPQSSRVWCTVTIDGRVVERQEAKGPWGRVFCQG